MAFIQVMTTTETKEQAQAIARHLVEDKAGCLCSDYRRRLKALIAGKAKWKAPGNISA